MKKYLLILTLFLSGCVVEQYRESKVHVYSNVPGNSSITIIENRPIVIPYNYQPYPYHYHPQYKLTPYYKP